MNVVCFGHMHMFNCVQMCVWHVHINTHLVFPIFVYEAELGESFDHVDILLARGGDPICTCLQQILQQHERLQVWRKEDRKQGRV